MQKRVLAFLMVMAMVLSLLPVSLVGAETAAAVPGYTMIMQKAHNQTEGSLTVDIYLQATTAGQNDVTGYQFKVNPAEGLVVTGAADATGNNGLAGSDNVFIYTPGSGALAVGTSRKLVASVTVTGETLPAQVADAFTLSDATVTTAEAQFTPAVEAVAYGCDHECAHGEGKWTPVTAAELTVADLPSGNYYLVEDISTSKTVTVKTANAKVNICLNGYTLSATSRILNIDGKNAEVSICDCTATGEGAELQAGTLLLKKYSWGNFRQSVTSKMTVRNVIIEGAEDAVSHTADPAKDANTGNAAAFYQATAAAGSTLLVENVLFQNIDAGKTVNDIRAEATFKDCTFVKVNGGSQLFNIGKDTEYEDDLAIFVTNGNPASTGTRALTIDGCKFIDCDDEVLDTNSKSQITYTLKGDVQAEGAFFVTKTCKLNLELGSKADVTIRTEEDETEETLGDNVVIPEGATLTAGTVLYDNTGSFIGYENGAFSFSSHAHDEHSFKAWDDSDSLPTEGSWYLTTDVTLNCNRIEVASKTTLNLDLNGHTIRQTKDGAGIYSVRGTLNLYDCADEYDANGNWIGGQITGGTQEFGGAIGVQRGVSSDTKETRPTFNMYGGRLAGNNAKGSGGAIYIASSLVSGGKDLWGGEFNMYGGELYNNTCTTIGAAVTAWGFSSTATSGSIGVDPAKEMGASFNLYGGKIHGHNKTLDGTAFVEGTINLTYDAAFNMYDGEIFDNHVERGGAVFANNKATTVNVTGGKIYGNSAVESAAKRAKTTSSNTYPGRGGAFCITAGQVTIKDVTIEDNYSTEGGAFFITGGGNTNVTLENLVLDGNYTVDHRTNDEAAANLQEWGNGGMMHIAGTATATTVAIKDCEITNNRATKDNTKDNDYNGAGGAIYANYTKNLTIDGCTFTGNVSELESGGAVYVRNGAKAVITNSTFIDNTAKVAGSAIYNLGTSIVELRDCLVTENTCTNAALGAVYVTSAGGRLILGGKVIINGNFNTKTADGGNGNNQADIVFQGQATRTELMEVNELGAGSHVNLYFTNSSSAVTKNDVASGYVKVTSGGSQSTWDCGWITVFKSTTDLGRNVSYVNDEFTFGHYHLMPDGTQQEFTAYSATTKPTAAGYYYLSKDITSSSEWTINVDGIHLCFNGKTLTSGSNSALNLVKGAGITLNVYDCTATYENDVYIGGGITGTKRTFGSGLRIEVPSSGKHIVNWYGGAIMNCVSNATGTGSSGGSALYTGNDANIEINWYNGAIFGNTTSDTNAKSTTTIAGVAQLQKAKMTIHDGLFYNNKCTDTGTGSNKAFGGLFYNAGVLTINGGKFFNNYAEDMGGVLYNSGTATINGGAVFEGNYVTQGYGGAIYNANTTNVLTINGTAEKPVIFQGNYVNRLATETTTDGVTTTTYTLGYGGAIEIMNGQSTTINYAHFLDNTSAYQGGAIRIGGGSGTSKVTMSNCYFSGNESADHGGAIYVNSDDLIMSNNLMEDNTSNTRGGAIFAAAGASKVNMTGDVLKNNYAKSYAGAFYAGNTLTLTMDGVQFIGNSSSSTGGWGGAIYSGNSTVTINASNCLFEGNSTKNGGALCLDWAKTMTFTGCTFKDNTATNGGAAYVRGNAAAVITFGGEGDLGCTFIGNEAATAGAVLCSSDKAANTPTHNFVNCSFTENVATSDTAALKVAGYSKTTMTDCTIQNNTSKIYGSLHQATSSCALTLVGKMIVTDNVSTSYTSHSENTDLYVQQYPQEPTAENPLINGFIDVTGLTAGSKIGVHMANNRGLSDPQFTMNGGAAKKDYFYATSNLFVLTTIENELALVKYVDEEGNAYTTVQDAIEAAEAAGETTFKLQASTTEELELTSIDTMDLNGKDGGTVTVPAGIELTLFDSATNSYTNENVAEVKVIGAVKAYAEVGTGNTMKRYVTIASEADATTGAKTYTAHRVYLAINSKTLRPYNNGVGFKAIFAGDEIVAEQVTYGIELSGYSDFNQVWKASFNDMVPGAATSTPNQKTIVVYNAISKADNSAWDQDLYGRPFITINGQTFYGKAVTVNMKTLAQNALASGDATVIAAVNEMMTECGVSAN